MQSSVLRSLSLVFHGNMTAADTLESLLIMNHMAVDLLKTSVILKRLNILFTELDYHFCFLDLEFLFLLWLEQILQLTLCERTKALPPGIFLPFVFSFVIHHASNSTLSSLLN